MAKRKKQESEFQKFLRTDYSNFLDKCRDQRSTEKFLQDNPHLVNNYILFFDTAKEGPIGRFKAFLNSGTDVNLQDGMGSTVLKTWVKRGNLKMARLLLEKGCNPDSGTPILSLFHKHRNRVAMLKLLIKFGANVNRRPNKNFRANLYDLLDPPESNVNKVLFEILKKNGGRPSTDQDIPGWKKPADPLVDAIKKWKRGRAKKSFSVHGDGLKNLKPISELTELTSLSIDGGEVKNYRPLESLTKLKKLTLRSDSHNSLASIGRLRNLTHLDIADGPIKNLAPLGDLEKLKSVSFRWCTEISNLKPLSKLPKLEHITIYECESIVDLRPLANCSHLRKIEIIDCFEIEDISPLKSLKKLRELMVVNTAVEDFSEFEEQKNLKLQIEEEY